MTRTKDKDNEQTGDIINFSLFEEGGLVKNYFNVAEDESILASIDESVVDDDFDDRSISTNAI